MGRACDTNGEKSNVHKILAGKAEGKRPLGRLRRRRKYNIKVDLEIAWGGMEWTDLA
jgi:hypothetical protein